MQCELTHAGLTHACLKLRWDIFGSLVGSEQNLLGEEHFSISEVVPQSDQPQPSPHSTTQILNGNENHTHTATKKFSHFQRL